MWSKLLTIFLLLLVAQTINAQYADDWVDPTKNYFKMTIGEDGVYRLTASELKASGIPVESIAASRYQVYRKGVELAIRTVSAANNTLSYLEFYAEKNDGSDDTELYVSPEAQPHPYKSLFHDSAAYFLTWHQTSSNGKRMEISSNLDATGLTPEPYHLETLLEVESTNYDVGLRYGSTFEILNPKFDIGEGWTGASFSGSKTFNLTLDNHDPNGKAPELEIVLLGSNNGAQSATVSVGPSTSSLREVGQLSFQGQNIGRFSETLLNSDISASGSLAVVITKVSGSMSLSALRLDYSQDLDFIGSEKKYRFRATNATKGYAMIPAENPSDLRVFEVTDPFSPRVFAKSIVSEGIEFIIPGMKVEREFLVFSAAKSVPELKKVDFNTLPISTSDYLIISHPDLNQTVEEVNPVDEYIAFRESEEGGSHQVLKMDVQDVYNRFGYGDPTPIAIRNFVEKAVNIGVAEYLFLIGKGVTIDYDYNRVSIDNLTHYVPTYGYPGADVLFSVDVINGNNEPALATGRLSAVNSRQVLAYLNKVKEMESLPFDELWRKNLLHLSGGITSTEQLAYFNYVSRFRDIAEGDFLGGTVETRQKQSTNAVQVLNVAKKVNEGVSQITFFGHSSSVVTDIEIGRPSEVTDGYANKSRYPMILVNGCNAGGIFSYNLGTQSDVVTWGEDWIRTPDAGAIGFIANSDYAQSSSLKRWSDLYYEFAFANDDHFASSVGQVINLVAERYFKVYGLDALTYSQVYQNILQGDPAVKIFGAAKTDYAIEPQGLKAISFNSDKVLANVDSFQIKIPIKNFGKTNRDSIKISVEQVFPDGSKDTTTHAFPRILSADTVNFTLYRDQNQSIEGSNLLNITLDPNDEVEELSELNNTYQLELFIPRGNTIPLYPLDFGLVPDDQVTLIWQSANQLEVNRIYLVEVDTTKSFNSAFKKSTEITADVLVTYQLDLTNLPDSTSVFWRTRFANPVGDEDTTWVSASFTKITDVQSTWMQISGQQFEDNAFQNVTYNPVTKKLEFVETNAGFEVRTHGVESGKVYEDYRVLVDDLDLMETDNLVDPDCKRKNAINAVVFSKQTAQPYRPFGDTGRDIFIDYLCGRAPQSIFNFNELDVLGGNRLLDSLISAMDEKDQILLFSFGTVNYTNWDEQLKSSLAEVGIQKSTVESLIDGQPVIFLGRKGETEGNAKEVISDGSGIPLKEQSIQLSNEVTGKYTAGTMSTPRIGPAKKWSSFDYEVYKQSEDFASINVIGVNQAGEETPLFIKYRLAELDISTVSALQYPFLRLSFNFSDNTDLSPANINYWSIQYDDPPEGLLMLPDQTNLEVAEGEGYSREYQFVNISSTDYQDSLHVSAEIINTQSSVSENQEFKIKAPAPGDSVRFELKTNTRGKTGENAILVRVLGDDLERYASNNAINESFSFTVKPDETNPVLDVTFDGGYILDGDIVSPNPSIQIKVKDENEYLFKDDTVGMLVELKAPCETCVYQKVNFTDPKLWYELASETEPFRMTYEPGPLEDGIYSLRVNATDESGNLSGQDYEINFEVINESTITHFYPYPNPFSTSTRFVFTLTGSVIPDKIKIQIMTVSGIVVREITQDEIGTIRIGNNISEYSWDGRDEFGDLLANGVYLYRVFIESNDQQMNHRFTSADRGFKNGVGKLYILR